MTVNVYALRKFGKRAIQSVVAASAVAVAGCASTATEPESQLIEDAIAANQYPEQDRIRLGFRQRDAYHVLSSRFVVYETQRGDSFLIRMNRACHSLARNGVFVAQRSAAGDSYLRSRLDSIGGCRLDTIYSISSEQFEELKALDSSA